MSLPILIVDADASAAQITGAIVQRLAPTATMMYASTPEDGWRCVERILPNGLIIDPGPFGTAGVLLIQLCKEQNPGMRIVVLASTLAPALRRDIQRIGVDVFLEKPTASAVLVEQLRTGLLGHRAGAIAPATRARAPVH